MSTSRAVRTQQQQMLGIVRGMAVTMQLAARATEGMQRAMEVFDEKAALRAQQSIAAVEQVMDGIVEPIEKVIEVLQSLGKTVVAADKSTKSFYQTSMSSGGMETHESSFSMGSQASTTMDTMSKVSSIVESDSSNSLTSANESSEKSISASIGGAAEISNVLELEAAYSQIEEKVQKEVIPTILSLSGHVQAAFSNQDSGPASQAFVDLMGYFDSFIDSNSTVADILASSWGVVESIYEGVNTAMTVYNIIQQAMEIYSTISTLAMYAQAGGVSFLQRAWMGLTAVLRANPFVFIISLIAGVVAALVTLWKSNDSVALFLLKAWNSILNFFDLIPGFFWGLVEGMLTPFTQWAKSIGKIYDLVINGIIDGINSILSIVNKVTGSDFEITARFSMEELADQATEIVKEKKKAADAKAKLNLENRDRLELEFANERTAKQASEELQIEENHSASKKNEDLLENALAKEDASNYSGASKSVLQPGTSIQMTGGRLDEVGKINDTVDISSEDIKMMRELAEMKNIQNFVTLQPSVNVQTGDIRNGMDVGSMVQAITTMLQDEISSSAEGVYR
ncbi:phage tail family protein [Paenibacillus sp. CAU 1782]